VPDSADDHLSFAGRRLWCAEIPFRQQIGTLRAAHVRVVALIRVTGV
jgi:hypothetical protein